MTEPLKGYKEPRLFTPPLRDLNPATSRGFEVIEFAKLIGEPLLPWQEFAVIHALELNEDGSYRFATVLILVARQNGKSHLKRIVSLWRLYLDEARLVIGAAQQVDQAMHQMRACVSTIHDCPALEAEFGQMITANGFQRFTLANGAQYKVVAANEKAGRGLSADEVTIDELRTQKTEVGWAALSKTTMARPRSQIWAMSNAGDDNSVVLNRLRGIALGDSDPTLGIFEWSAPDECDLDDKEAWCQANPGLGHIITEAKIRSALGSDTAPVFRTEVLCQRVDQLEGAVDLEAWRACVDHTGNMNSLKDRIAASFDVSPDGLHATLAVAAVLPDGRVRTEIAGAWPTTEVARRELPELLGKIKPVALAFYPAGPGGAFSPMIRKLEGPRCVVHELTGMRAAEACQGLADLTLARRIIHPGQAILDEHVGGAQKLATADGWRFTRRGKGHVDAAYACAGAVYVALSMPAPVKARIRVISW